MLSKIPDPTRRGRVLVFAVVALLHLLTTLLLLHVRNTRVRLRSIPTESLTILQLTEPLHHSDRAVIHSPLTFLIPEKIEPHITDEPLSISPSITSSSGSSSTIDLASETAGAAQLLDEAEAEERRRNLAGPSASQLEWSRKNAVVPGEHHKLGDTQRFDGGEVITWENDRCYLTTRGVTNFGLAETKRVCKDPPKPVTDLFKDMRKKLEEPDARSTP